MVTTSHLGTVHAVQYLLVTHASGYFVAIGSLTLGMLLSVSQRLKLSTSESTSFSSRLRSLSPVYGSILLNFFSNKLDERSKSAAGCGICSKCSSSQIGCSNIL